MKSTFIVRSVALAALTFSLAACKSNTAAQSPTQTLVIQQSADIPTLDPGTTYDTASGQVVENLYETLVGYRGSSLTDLEGVLATEWEARNDGLQYRFTLRDGVKFHSGNPFTCADAEYTFRRNLVTNSADSGNWFLSESLLGTGANAKDDPGITWEKIAGAVQCEDNTLVFNLPKADPAFLSKLAYIGQGIVDSVHAKQIGEWDGTPETWKDAVGTELTGSALSQQPSGTGAYKLLQKTATAVTLQAFDGYWGERGNIGNVIIQKVPEQAARLQAFQKGDADIVETGGRPVIEAQLRGQPGIAVLDNLPDTTAVGISMNEQIRGSAIGSGKLDGQGIPANFFSDLEVRRGFVAAFNVPQFIQEVQGGQGAARNVLLPDRFPGYDSALSAPTFDLDAARAHFQAAWNGQVWEKGFTVSVSYRANSIPAQTGMEMLKKNIESLNPKFRVNIVPREWSEIIKGSNQGTEAMVTTAWAPDYADPDNFMYTFYNSKGYYNPRINAIDAQLDTWTNEARMTTDAAARNDLYRRVAQRAQDQAYYILLPSNPGILAYRDHLQGISAENYNPMIAFVAGTYFKNLSKK